MRKIISIIQLVRLHNCLMAAVGVWLGGWLVNVPADDIKLVMTSIAVAFVCGAGNAVNDFLDIDSDRINHPQRPLPSGRLPGYMALLVMFVMNGAAVIFSLFVNPVIFVMVQLDIILLFLYNFLLKKTMFWGNLVIALLGGLTLITGGLVGGYRTLLIIPGAIIPAVFAVLIHLGREFLKDLADRSGDRAAGLKTLATRLSQRTVLRLITLNYIILIPLTLLPLLYNWYNDFYSYIVLFGVDLPLVALIAYLWLPGRRIRFGLAASLIKLLMIIGLTAFLLGKNTSFF